MTNAAMTEANASQANSILSITACKNFSHMPEFMSRVFRINAASS